jgi:hypothetical protein
LLQAVLKYDSDMGGAGGNLPPPKVIGKPFANLSLSVSLMISTTSKNSKNAKSYVQRMFPLIHHLCQCIIIVKGAADARRGVTFSVLGLIFGLPKGMCTILYG